MISLLDYSYHEPTEGFQFRYDLREISTRELMTDRLNFVFLELPNARQLDTARNLLKLGVPMETVVQATGLSPEQLDALRM